MCSIYASTDYHLPLSLWRSYMILQVSPAVVAKILNLRWLLDGWYEPLINCVLIRITSKLVVAVQKKGYIDFQELPKEENVATSYGNTLQKDSNYSLPCSWATAEPSTFLIRGENYLKDNQKVFLKFYLIQTKAFIKNFHHSSRFSA